MNGSSFDTARKKHWSVLGPTVAANLSAKGFQAVYAESKKEALDEVLKLIPAGSSVGIPGSVTIREIGAMDALAERGCDVIHHWDPSLTGEERLQRLQDELLADYFLTSSNAVTKDGMLVNIDGNGNRVSGMAWGKNTLIFVIGLNKVTADIDEAISRTRNTATPPNALRLGLETPCTKTGCCVNCSSEERVCKALLILERATGGRKTHVILVGEDLGF
ncbi:MAG TPA: lactate utilization protein [Aminivibrio sp.]|nr:lactate utilization protein [Aminivibrio sp.]